MWTHFDFAVIFAGLGYVGLWAFAAGDIARHLSPGLQITGMVAAAVAAVRVAMLVRARHAKPAAAAAPAPAPFRKARRNSILRRAPRRRPSVEPRSEFGLRKPGVWPKR
jgi:hypothetical protein